MGNKIEEKNYLKGMNVKLNDSVSLSGGEINKQFTKPPSFMTESELIEKMEKYQIGTDASMAIHIKNIITREYVFVEG